MPKVKAQPQIIAIKMPDSIAGDSPVLDSTRDRVEAFRATAAHIFPSPRESNHSLNGTSPFSSSSFSISLSSVDAL